MEFKKDIHYYSRFTFEDFLQDDFFIGYVLNPTEESEFFWANFQKENKDKLSDFHKAVGCIRDLNKDVPTEKLVRQIWSDIQKINRKQRVKKRWISVAGWAAAASIALFFIARFYFYSPGQDINSQDIRTFAGENISSEEITEARLILSDHNIVSLSDKESVVLYDSTSIKVNSREILKEEISKNKTSAFNQLIIPKGKRSYLVLSDNTRIWVNSGTRLIYPAEFASDKREIFVDGEIFLDVYPDKNRPFIVQTHEIDIQVMGTQFNVQSYGSDTQKRIVLKSGAVKISSVKEDRDILLQPAEMYERNGTRETVVPVDVNIYTSWIDGIYICEGERLDVIATRLSRYYGKEFMVDRNAAGLRCYGKLDLKENPGEVMNIIRYIAPVDYTCENDKYIITYKP